MFVKIGKFELSKNELEQFIKEYAVHLSQTKKKGNNEDFIKFIEIKKVESN